MKNIKEFLNNIIESSDTYVIIEIENYGKKNQKIKFMQELNLDHITLRNARRPFKKFVDNIDWAKQFDSEDEARKFLNKYAGFGLYRIVTYKEAESMIENK